MRLVTRQQEKNMLRKIKIFLVFFLCVTLTIVKAQTITGCSYWFDNDPSTMRNLSGLSLSDKEEAKLSLDLSGLSPGMHTLNVRFRNSNGTYSAVESAYFFKQENYNGYSNYIEYWFDNNRSKIHRIAVTPHPVDKTTEFAADLSGIGNGMHSISMRPSGAMRGVGAAVSGFFYKTEANDATAGVEYWFNDNYAERKTLNTTKGNSIITNNISTKGVKYGLNTINFRVGGHGVVEQYYFAKINPKYFVGDGTTENKIAKFRYWFNDNAEEAVEVAIEPAVDSLNQVIPIQTMGLPLGKNKLSYSFVNSLGAASLDEAYFNNKVAPPKGVKLKTLSPNINELIPKYLQEYATVVFHFLLEDEKGKAVPNYKVNFKLEKHGKTFQATSDASGIVRIDLPIYGESPEKKDDDLIPVNETDVLKFVSVQAPAGIKVKLADNEYFPKTIAILPRKALTKKGSFGSDVSKSWNLGFLNAEVGAGATSEFKYKFDDLGVDISKTTIKVGVNLDLNAKIKNIELPVFDTKMNGNLNLSAYCSQEMSGKEDYRIYLMACQNIFILKDMFNPDQHFYMASIAKMWPGSDDLDFGFKRTFGGSVALGLGMRSDLDIMKEKVTKIKFTPSLSCELAAAYDYTQEIEDDVAGNSTNIEVELGAKGSLKVANEYIKKVENTWKKYGLRKKQYTGDFSLDGALSLKFGLERTSNIANYKSLKLSTTIKHKVKEGLNFDHIPKDSPISGKLKGISTNQSMAEKSVLEIGEGLMSFINESSAPNKPFQSILNIKAGDEWTIESMMKNNIKVVTDFIDRETSKKKYVQKDINDLKNGLHQAESTDYQLLGLNFAIPLPWHNTNFNGDFKLTKTYKNADAYYHAQAKRMLPIYYYNDIANKEMFFNAIDDGYLSELQTKLSNGLSQAMNTIKNTMTDAGEWISDKIGQATKFFSNSSRSYSPALSKYRHFLTSPQKQRSILTFEVPGQEQAFASDTETEFYYYYPGGDLRGKTEQEDTILVVSDVFFFSAKQGNLTLQKSPNGNFKVRSKVGKDDLTSLGLSATTPVALYFLPTNADRWRKLGAANSELAVNELGVYALGVSLEYDTIPPTISMELEDTTRLLVRIEDNTLVRWKDTEVIVNGKKCEFENRGNGLLVVSLDNVQHDTKIIANVTAFDISGNKASAISSFATTGIEAQLVDMEKISIVYDRKKQCCNIKIPDGLIGQLASLYNEKGELLKQDRLTKKTNTLNMSQYQDGVYIVNIGKESYKFLKSTR